MSTNPSLEALVATHVDLVYSAALRQLKDPHLADDVTQAVFMVLVQKFEHLPPAPLLAPWLLKVTRYTALTSLRAKRRAAARETLVAKPESTPAPTHEQEILALLDEALMSLSESDRTLLTLRYLQNQPVVAVAAALQLRDNTAAKKIQRALEKLRAYFQRRNITASDSALSALLPATLFHAPQNLLPHILTAASAAPIAATTLPLGVLLMTAKIKLVAAFLGILFLATAAYFLFRPHTALPTSPDSPALAAAPAAPATPPTEITLTGTIKDQAGNPIEHAFVSQGRSPFDRKSFHSTYTDIDGTFLLQNIQPGDDLILTATAPNFSPQLIHSSKLNADPQPFAFTLTAGHTFHFHFTDQRGNPLRNVLAEPLRWNDVDVLRSEYSTKNTMTAIKAFMSDANGNFTWSSAPAEPVEFTFSVMAINSPYQRKGGDFTASDKTIEITLKDALTIAATVTDAKTHQPIPVFTFFIGEGSTSDKPDGWSPQAHPSTNGAFTYNDSQSSKFAFIRIEAPGYPPLIQSIPRDNPPANLSLELSTAAALQVTILTPDKKPAHFVKVFSITQDAYLSFQNDTMREGISPSDPPFQTTDDAGHCLLSPSGKKSLRILVFAPEGFADLLASALPADHSITLEPWATVKLHIHDGNTPLAHAQVIMSYLDVRDAAVPNLGINFETKTDANGDLVLSHVPSRPFNLHRYITANENTSYSEGIGENLKNFTPTGEQSLDIPLDTSGQTLTGRIVNPDGSPLANPTLFSLGRLEPPQPPSLFTEAEAADLKKQTTPEDRKRWQAAFNQQNPKRVADYHAMFVQYYKTHHPLAFIANPDGTFTAHNLLPGGDYTLTIYTLDPTTHKHALVATHTFSVPADITTTPFPLGDLPLEPLKADAP